VVSFITVLLAEPTIMSTTEISNDMKNLHLNTIDDGNTNNFQRLIDDKCKDTGLNEIENGDDDDDKFDENALLEFGMY
jgi:hypothetical protein